MAIGHAGSLVPGLTALLAEHPFRERLRGALMLALYRAGRTVDALDVYRVGRAVMVDELGIEPGPALRELEHAILTDDPTLMTVGASSMNGTELGIGQGAADGEEQSSPAELPVGAPGFTGRATELPRLMELLRSRRGVDATGCVATISGPGGVGKSTLAIQAATAVADEFPDGQLYVNLRGATPGVDPLRSGEALARFQNVISAWPLQSEHPARSPRRSQSSQPRPYTVGAVVMIDGVLDQRQPHFSRTRAAPTASFAATIRPDPREETGCSPHHA